MSELLERWHGDTWTAIVTREQYGLHFSVGGKGRAPSDEQVNAARSAYLGVGVLPSAEITRWWSRNGQVNPWVRHFASIAHAEKLSDER